jgi:hypothetical protein
LRGLPLPSVRASQSAFSARKLSHRPSGETAGLAMPFAARGLVDSMSGRFGRGRFEVTGTTAVNAIGCAVPPTRCFITWPSAV